MSNVLQIIGRGGFAREVASYQGDMVDFFEYECEGIDYDADTIIAIGNVQVRQRIVKKFPHLKYTIRNNGVNWRNVIAGEGTIICPGCQLTVDIKIGRHVIINLNCTIGHDCVISDFVTISPGANISGNVTIGDLCYIGTNAVIREKISICSGVTIGAGGVVVKDITEPGVYVGNPVKKIG